MDLRLAGGGLWSTGSDLLRFGRAILRGGELDGARVLSPAFVELMTRATTTGGLGIAPDRLDDEHYALGWVRRSPAGIGSADAFGHGGVTGTRLWIDPAWDLVFVYLTGAWGMSPQPSRAALHAVYGALRRGPSR
jgi:CubicO group peptidase (beta-lactamase class C family)